MFRKHIIEGTEYCHYCSLAGFIIYDPVLVKKSQKPSVPEKSGEVKWSS